MPNAMGGVQRALALLRPLDRNRSLTVRRLRRRAVGITRGIVDRLVPVPTRRPEGVRPVAPRHLASHRELTRGSRFRLQRRLIKVRLGSDRALPMAIAVAVIAAGIVSLGPSAVRPVGAAQGASQQARIAIGGTGGVDYDLSRDPAIGAAADGLGSYVDDGTFYKPVAVDTIVESGSDLLRHYTVRSGDTLTGIASRFGVSMMTIWWANKLTTKDSLHVGQSLVIPPVSGLIVTVKAGDSLDSLGTQYKVDPQAIMDLNNLTDPILVAGQVLVLPGAKGAPIPVPKVTTTYHSTSTVSTKPLVYTSGTWAWPVVGGGNYISQYFSSYHLGVDIAAKYGTPIVAARAGTVIFRGWKAGGGGYQVWIYHGSNLYTVYLHMSAMLVSTGQSVAKGQQIGRVGMTGNATGPHCHFGVSIGEPWQGYFVNPLRYF